MKKLNLLLGIIIGLTILSCSSDDNNDNEELSMSELLTQNSPWTFDHYEMLSILDSGNSDLTQTEIENETDIAYAGQVLTFNSDGTGNATFPSDQEDDNEIWQWQIINENQLQLTFDGGQTSILENITVSNSQLTIQIESVTYDEDVTYEVLHLGNFFYE
jgi:hypothetical protein